jgi:ActR/RegA family two-component response regulator
MIIEDGDEYLRFFERYLTEHSYRQVRKLEGCLEALESQEPPQALVVDLRFDRVPREALTGDVDEVAEELFGGDIDAAWRYIVDNQGFLILRELREAGHTQPALLISELSERRLENLRRLYGDLDAVPTFDTGSIRSALEALL